MSTLAIKDLQVSVSTEDGPKEILKGVTLTIDSNETHAIMGPNGSGKSTLAYSVAGHPKYEITGGSVTLDGEDVLAMSVDERARAGLFLAMQYPVEVPGVSVANFLRTAKTAIDGEAPKLRTWVKDVNAALEHLNLDSTFSARSTGAGRSVRSVAGAGFGTAGSTSSRARTVSDARGVWSDAVRVDASGATSRVAATGITGVGTGMRCVGGTGAAATLAGCEAAEGGAAGAFAGVTMGEKASGSATIRRAGASGLAGTAAAGAAWTEPLITGSPSFSSGQSAACLDATIRTGVGAARPAITVEAATPKPTSAPAPATPNSTTLRFSDGPGLADGLRSGRVSDGSRLRSIMVRGL